MSAELKVPPSRLRHDDGSAQAPASRDGSRDHDYCTCRTPLLDSDVGAEGDGDTWDDFCYRCRRFLKDD